MRVAQDSGAPMIAPRLRHESNEVTEKPDSAEPTLATEPIAKAEPIDPTEPTLRMEPALPIDRIDPVEPIDRMESFERHDSMLLPMPGVCRTRRSPAARSPFLEVRALGTQRRVVSVAGV